jgi:uncharacterized protein YqgC (DUF456 family)
MVISYFLEIAGMFLLPLLAVLIAIYSGQLYGSYLIKKSPELPKTAVGSIVSAVCGLLTFMLAAIFAMVIFLILALDHPETRLVKINQQPIITLQEQLHGK